MPRRVNLLSYPPHARLRACEQAWVELEDAYAVNVIRQGLKLSWVPDLDPENPTEGFRFKWGRNPPDLPDVVESLIGDMLKTGSVVLVNKSFLKACSSIFAIPKAGSDKWRLITNLRNINEFLVTETFKLPSLNNISTYLIPGWWAGKIDLTNAYGHLPISERDIPYMGFRFKDQ